MKKNILSIIGFVLCSIVLIGCSRDSVPERVDISTGTIETEITTQQVSTDALFKMIRPSLVQIGTTKKQYFSESISSLNNNSINWRGRGIAIGTGEVITAGHLFDDSEAYYVLRVYDGTILPIKNVWKDSQDLALLGVDYKLTSYESISYNSSYVSGDRLLTIIGGNILTGKAFAQNENKLSSSLILEEGMSGSPLFTKEGVLIGINNEISRDENGTTTFSQLFTIPFSAIPLSGDMGMQDGEE